MFFTHRKVGVTTFSFKQLKSRGPMLWNAKQNKQTNKQTKNRSFATNSIHLRCQCILLRSLWVTGWVFLLDAKMQVTRNSYTMKYLLGLALGKWIVSHHCESKSLSFKRERAVQDCNLVNLYQLSSTRSFSISGIVACLQAECILSEVSTIFSSLCFIDSVI